MPATLARGLSYGALPVTGNRGSTHRWSTDCANELDDSLHEAGLLKDGATLWMSYLFLTAPVRCALRFPAEPIIRASLYDWMRGFRETPT